MKQGNVNIVLARQIEQDTESFEVVRDIWCQVAGPCWNEEATDEIVELAMRWDDVEEAADAVEACIQRNPEKYGFMVADETVTCYEAILLIYNPSTTTWSDEYKYPTGGGVMWSIENGYW